MKELRSNKMLSIIAVATLALICTLVVTQTGLFDVVLAEDKTKNTTMENIIGWVAGIGGGIIAIFLIISIVKDGLEYAKGNGSGSPLKIIGKVLFLLLMIGLIFVATQYHKWGKNAESIGSSLISTVSGEASKVFK